MASSKSSKKLDFDPYKVLLLEPGCEPGHVDKAYKKQALKWHPDKNPERTEKAQQMFLKVYQAYEFLKDAAKRMEYDEGIAAKRRRAEFEQERQSASSAQRQAHLVKLQQAEAKAAAVGLKRKSTESAADQLIEQLRREGAIMMQKLREEEEDRQRKAEKQQQQHMGSTPGTTTAGGAAAAKATRQLREEVDELEKALFGGTVI